MQLLFGPPSGSNVIQAFQNLAQWPECFGAWGWYHFWWECVTPQPEKLTLVTFADLVAAGVPSVLKAAGKKISIGPSVIAPQYPTPQAAFAATKLCIDNL